MPAKFLRAGPRSLWRCGILELYVLEGLQKFLTSSLMP